MSSPHAGQPVYRKGRDPIVAPAAMVMVHGRGGSASDILQLADEFAIDEMSYCAPQAAGNSWYPYRFLEPVERNEPWLSSALELIASVFGEMTLAGIPSEKIFLFGFSQGGCLALEFAARNPRHFAGVIGLSGGLIGVAPGPYRGSLEGTPVFLGCSDVDPHIPVDRVHFSGQTFEQLNGSVKSVVYPGMAHTINQDEIDIVRTMIADILS